ncbi:AAA family ATPase [Alcaligenes phenolicus]|uniref:AAA family ATPase n=1 Tax=Alcaligenes phenolicus TaxID=232846 RepID=UPI00352F5408
MSIEEDKQIMDYQEALDCARALMRAHPRIVFMMCGIAGSGKTTFAQALEKMGCQRLSIDEEIWRTSGRFGVDYSEHDYPDLQASAEKGLRRRLGEMLRKGTKAVIDFSFWSTKARADYRELVRRNGHHCQLVYMNVPEKVLRERLIKRASRHDANAAFPVTEELLRRYIRGFEPPSGKEAWTVEQGPERS